MKFILTLVVVAAVFIGQVKANDTLLILNTVFHGLNTLVSITRPSTVVVTPAPVVQQPVVVTQQTVVTQPTVVTTQPALQIVNGQTYIIQNGVAVPYIPPKINRHAQGPRRPPPPPPHRGGKGTRGAPPGRHGNRR